MRDDRKSRRSGDVEEEGESLNSQGRFDILSGKRFSGVAEPRYKMLYGKFYLINVKR